MPEGEPGALPPFGLPPCRVVPSSPFTIRSMLRIWLEGDVDVVDEAAAAETAGTIRTTSRLAGDGERRSDADGGEARGDPRCEGDGLRLCDLDDRRLWWWW